jgi:membrane fusion protein (multidrug efflux system)
VNVKENQLVKKGDVLVEIDPSDYEIKKGQQAAAVETAKSNRLTAKAGLGLVEARLETAKASAEQARAEAESADTTAKRAAADFERAKELRERKVISPQEFDSARAAAESTDQNLQAARKKLAGAESGVVEAQAQVDAARTYIQAANVKVESAELDQKQADLDLARTHVLAPEDGRIAKKSAEPGAYVQVGQNLLALVPQRVWVVANFKETQLAGMRAGQPAEIRISAFPGRVYRGHIDSFHPGSGARFSLFPPENSTGNFVKVVQRVPVKIEFDEVPSDLAVIGPGMSIEPEVRIRGDIPIVFVLMAAGAIGVVVFLLLTARARKRLAA